MENDDSLFTWGDNWWIEGNRAWFVSGMHNVLFDVNLKTNECESAVCIPEEAYSKLRLTPLCIKCGDDIFCMPDVGNNIWVYSICSGAFSKISIRNPDKTRLGLRDFWKYGGKLFAVSNGLGKIIEINIPERKIDGYYALCVGEGAAKGVKDGVFGDKLIKNSIRTGNFIYSLSSSYGGVCRFDLMTKKIETYSIPDIGRRFYAFCFDGEKFWFGGHRKEVYVWDKDNNKITAIGGLPKEFGIYDFSEDTDGKANCESEEYETPTFLYSLAVGGYVWFVPFRTNKIICVDKRTHEICVFEVTEEDETMESLIGRRGMACKYILEYVKDDRYIGLFSLKNNCILEIDALEKTYGIKHYDLSAKCMDAVINIYYEPVLHESSRAHRRIFKHILIERGMAEVGGTIGNAGTVNTGKSIYEAIKHIV